MASSNPENLIPKETNDSSRFDAQAIDAAIADPHRLAAVQRTGLLDAPAEQSFDRLTRLAVKLTGAPVAFISLIDQERDFYLSENGFGEPLASVRQLEGRTFCHYGLVSDGPLILDDVTQDPVMREVPTVKTLGVRAYAGVPLITEEGRKLGSFCAIDFQPRPWSELEVEVLKELAHATAREIHLRNAVRDLQAATLAKSEFLANVSHEIRTPMNAIFGFCHMLGREDLPQNAQQMVQRIGGATRSLLGLINDVLDFEKIAANRLDIENIPFRLSDALENLASIMAATLEGKPIELIVGPPPVGAEYLQGDSLRLGQILINLAGNAIKFTEAGEVSVTVKLLRQDGDGRLWLRFCVKDSGIGIPEDRQKRIFDAFSQADSSTARRYGGTGLGLAISRRLVELLGGELRVSSTPGQGSEFSFELPFETSNPTDNAIPEMSHLRVLVADDHQTARDVMAATVASLGWHAETVDSGEQAILKASDPAAAGYDILLMDWRMPGIDGLQAAARISETANESAPPVIVMVTAYDREYLRDMAGSNVADIILTKPVTSSSLYNAVISAKTSRGRWRREETRQDKPRLAGLRLLIVDDSDMNLEVAMHILGGEGAAVEQAPDGGVALGILGARPDDFDVVLMDMQMPGMDGYEATRQIRANPSTAHQPVIALSAGAFRMQRDMAFEAGVDDFVAKPFEVDQLVNAILRHCPSRGDGVAPVNVPESPVAQGQAPRPAALLNLARLLSVLGSEEVGKVQLLKFSGRFADSIDKLTEMSDSAEIAAFLHKLRGAAAQLGMDRLAAHALEIERQVHRGRTDPAGMKQLQQVLKASLGAIADYAQEPLQAAADRQPALVPVSGEVLRSTLEALVTVLDRDDVAGAEAVLQTLRAMKPDEELASVREAVAQYDLRKAESLVQEMLEQLVLEESR